LRANKEQTIETDRPYSHNQTLTVGLGISPSLLSF